MLTIFRTREEAYARISAIKVCAPRILIAHFMLYASTFTLISVRTFRSVRVKKCAAPIQNFRFPKGCSTV